METMMKNKWGHEIKKRSSIMRSVHSMYNEKRLTNLRQAKLKEHGLDALTPEQLSLYRHLTVVKRFTRAEAIEFMWSSKIPDEGAIDAVSQVRSLSNQTPRRDEKV